MRFFALFFTLFIFHAGNAQVKLNTTSHDFGEIEGEEKMWFEIEATNLTDRQIRLLRITNPENEFEFKFSSQTIEPSQKAQYRIQFNPLERGKRNITLQLFFNNQTIDFKVKANVKKIPADYVSCPDFDQVIEKTTETTMTTRDRDKLEAIPDANITLTTHFGEELRLKTNRKGSVTESIPLGYYYIRIEQDNYVTKDTAMYLNSKTKTLVFDLKVKLQPTEESEEIVEIIPKEETDIITPEPEIEDEIEPEPVGEYSLQEYKPNNITFLMDVSTSMQKLNRLPMLKEALTNLVDIMRPEDKLTLITYASTTNILLESEPVKDRAAVKRIIAAIDGRGTTAGGKGLKKAYNITRSNFMENGNNHIYIATDGAFNKNDEQIERLVKQNAKKDIQLSVIFLSGSDFAYKKMIELTEAGEGALINIKEEYQNGDEIKNLIKSQTKK